MGELTAGDLPVQTRKIPDLPLATSVGDSDQFVIRQGTTDKKVAGSVIKQDNADYAAKGNFCVESGVADAYIFEPSTGYSRVSSLQAGMRFYGETENSNTGPATINVHGKGVKSIVSQTGTALSSNEIDGRFEIEYDAYLDNFTLISKNTASEVNYTQGGTGSTQRTLTSKLQETVSVKDFGAVGDGVADDTAEIQAAIDSVSSFGGGKVFIPSGEFNHTGLTVPSTVSIVGTGFGSKLTNTATDGSHSLYISGGGSDVFSTTRNVEQLVRDLWIFGNSLSGDGIRLEIIGSYDNGTVDKKPSVGVFDHLKITGHGGSGVQFGESASVGAGNKITVSNSDIGYNNYGVKIEGQSNTASIVYCNIHNNTNDGVRLNFVASTNLVFHSQIMDNGGWGVFSFSAEQPLVQFNGFNRNAEGSVAFSGSAIKYTEAGIIVGNLFGDNGASATTAREVSLTYAKGTTIVGNYFYGTGQDSMIYISDFVEGARILTNHFKDLTTETKLEIKAGVIGSYYEFEDDQAGTRNKNHSNQFVEYDRPSSDTLFTIREDGNTNDFFNLLASGEMNWGSGQYPTDVEVKRVVAGSLRNSGSYEMNTMMIEDGISEPSARSGYARMFVDSADGDLKIKFSDGTVKNLSNSPQAAKAWVNFNGTGTVSIRDSYNVSSITDNGTGDYTINFTNDLSNVNYAVSGSGLEHAGANPAYGTAVGPYSTSSMLVSSCRIHNYNLDMINPPFVIDGEFVSVIIHAN